MKAPLPLSRRPRPLRGTREDTRARLLAAAAQEFERNGFYGTDTNRIARTAGYAPGTFYKHFVDKTAVFVAVYDAWVEQEWRTIEALAARPGTRRERVTRIVAFLIEHHRRWRGFRATLRALVATDAHVRRHHRAARTAQLARFRALRPASDEPARAGLSLLYVERVCDALADDEAATLGISEAEARAALVDQLCAGR
jgi:AcrR family transcriptional regulator